jgi:hypothetical protein
VSLKEARELAQAARLKIRAGEDPIRERQKETQIAAQAASKDRTFMAAAEAAIASRESTWRNEKHVTQWRYTLETYAYPVLGKLPVSEIQTDDLVRVLRPIWSRIPETASRLRGRIEVVLDHARAKGWRTGDNPARWKGNLADLLPKPTTIAKVKHFPSLPWQKVPAFMQALQQQKGMAAIVLQFAILCASRSGEARGMTWGEVDEASRIWTIPGQRMKMGVMHRVPLSDEALAILAQVKLGTPKRDTVVFPGLRGNKPLTEMTIPMMVRAMSMKGLQKGDTPRWVDYEGIPIVAHGFRSSFRDWAGETRSEGREIAERALAHAVGGVEGAYARSDLLEKRRPLMQAWADFTYGIG